MQTIKIWPWESTAAKELRQAKESYERSAEDLAEKLNGDETVMRITKITNNFRNATVEPPNGVLLRRCTDKK